MGDMLLYDNIWDGMGLYRMVCKGKIQYGVALYCLRVIVWCGTVWYRMVWYGIVWEKPWVVGNIQEQYSPVDTCREGRLV